MVLVKKQVNIKVAQCSHIHLFEADFTFISMLKALFLLHENINLGK